MRDTIYRNSNKWPIVFWHSTWSSPLNWGVRTAENLYENVVKSLVHTGKYYNTRPMSFLIWKTRFPSNYIISRHQFDPDFSTKIHVMCVQYDQVFQPCPMSKLFHAILMQLGKTNLLATPCSVKKLADLFSLFGKSQIFSIIAIKINYRTCPPLRRQYEQKLTWKSKTNWSSPCLSRQVCLI